MTKFRTALLSAVAVATFATAAHAAGTENYIAAFGAWKVDQGIYPNGTPFCAMTTFDPTTSHTVALAISPATNQLRVIVSDPRWNVATRISTTFSVKVDGFDAWTVNDAPAQGNSVWTHIRPDSLREFIHRFTSGSKFTLSAHGTGDTVVNLAGTTDSWKPFMECVNVVVPTFGATIAASAAPGASAPQPQLPSPDSTPIPAPAPTPAANPLDRIFGPGVLETTSHDNGIAGEVALTPDGSATMKLTAAINGREFRFTLDSGAADIAISENMAKHLVTDGTLAPSDFVRMQKYVTANGSIEAPVFKLKTVTIGGRTVHNVEMSVDPNNSMALLGQAFLRRFKTSITVAMS